MTRFQGLFTLTTAICCVILGAWLGSVMGTKALSSFGRAPKVFTAANNAEIVQDNLASVEAKALSLGTGYLIIGVNADHSVPNPIIDAIWAVTFTPDYSMVEFLGLVPTPEINRAFYERPVEFTALVSAQMPTPIRRQFVLDSAQFIWIIDTLGGLRLSGTILDGARTLDYARSGRDMDEQLLHQAAAVQALLVQVAVLGQRDELMKVLEKVRAGTLSHDEINMITTNFSPLRMERVRVRVVTADTL